MSTTCPPYGGGNCGSTPTTTVVTVPSHTPAAHADPLPFTGGDVVGLSLIGVGAILAGSFLARARKRATA